MKYFLAVTAIALPLAFASTGANAGERGETPTAFVEADLAHFAYDDVTGYQAVRAALDPSARHSGPTQGAYEATERDNYGHAWIYLGALQDHDPRSPHQRASKRAYGCYLTARRNAMAAVASEGRDATGAWLQLADRCAARLRLGLVTWARANAVPLVPEDLRGAAPYRMFFPFDTAAITPIGDHILRYIARFERAEGAARIVVAGHADRSGREDYNMALSKQRADAVDARFAGYMENHIPHRVYAAGETTPLALTRDGVRHPRNRRVEIMLGRL
ncbi:MAG: OmpA family protein [Proteobacteria bacterium]|nr:OmpA family protein [Pseudomonadota bacterium]